MRKSFIMAVALSGAVINTFYSVDILRSIYDSQYNSAIKEIMISAVVLEIGWITLLIWVIIDPFERRHILLFTIPPILLGNILHGVNQFWSHSENLMAIALNTAFGLFYSALFFAAFMAGKDEKN
ncbi:uncharacterized protein Dvar_79540 [Desulfosarcina variabilis str. Montpellier]|uniref:hypothetical protein n=1 Tax=Desulfosarcina variabilis TaxID=2300 RepID=UPI003AFA5282